MNQTLYVGIDVGNRTFDLSIAQTLDRIVHVEILSLMARRVTTLRQYDIPFIKIGDEIYYLGRDALQTHLKPLDSHVSGWWHDESGSISPLAKFLLAGGILRGIRQLGLLGKEFDIFLNVAIPFDEFLPEKTGRFPLEEDFFASLGKEPLIFSDETDTEYTLNFKILNKFGVNAGKFLPQPEFGIYSLITEFKPNNEGETVPVTNPSWLYHEDKTPTYIRVFDNGGGTVESMTYSIHPILKKFLPFDVLADQQRVGFWEVILPAFRAKLVEKIGDKLNTTNEWILEEAFLSGSLKGHSLQAEKMAIIAEFAPMYVDLWKKGIGDITLISFAIFLGRQMYYLKDFFTKALEADAKRYGFNIIHPENPGIHAGKGAMIGAFNDSRRLK